jgi:hypothetical protein
MDWTETVQVILSIAALLVAILALTPYLIQQWRNKISKWPYQAGARWVPSPLPDRNLRIALVITNLTTRTARFQLFVDEGGEPQFPLTIEPLDEDPLANTSRLRVGPLDQCRFRVTLDHPEPATEPAYLLLQEGAHSDKFLRIEPWRRETKGPKALLEKYRAWRRARLRPVEDLGNWGA